MTRYAMAALGALTIIMAGCIDDNPAEPTIETTARLGEEVCSATPFEEPVPPFVIPISSDHEPDVPGGPTDLDTRTSQYQLGFIMNAAGCNSCCGAAGYTLATFNGTCYCANVADNQSKSATVCKGDPVGICTFNAALPSNPPPAKGKPGQHNQVKVTASTW